MKALGSVLLASRSAAAFNPSLAGSRFPNGITMPQKHALPSALQSKVSRRNLAVKSVHVTPLHDRSHLVHRVLPVVSMQDDLDALPSDGSPDETDDVFDDMPSDGYTDDTDPYAASSTGDGGRFSGVKKALVAGATGGTGRAIVKRLLAEGITVRALVRDASKANLPAEVETMVGDVYEYATLPAAVKGCDVVLCATGARPDFADPLGPFKVDYVGTGNLASAARNAGVNKFVFVSSIAADELLYPLNLAFGVLFWKKRGEEQLQRSGIDYTIVRPGGLQNDGEPRPVVMERENTFGLPPARRQAGSILRAQVADLCVEALVTPAASNKIVEVIAVQGEPEKSAEELYAAVF